MNSLSLYCDVNYEPVSTYWQIEGWCLIAEGVHPYCPNLSAMARCGMGPNEVAEYVESFKHLVELGVVKPVACARYLDPSKRKELVEKYKTSNPKRSQFYVWTPLDDFLAEHVAGLDDSYLEVGNAASSLPETRPELYRQLQQLLKDPVMTERLRGDAYQKFSLEQNHKELLRDIGNDLGIMDAIGANAMILADEQAPLHAVSALLRKALPPNERCNPEIDTSIKFTSSDLRIARDFTDRLSKQIAIRDALPEFRASDFCRAFRLFVVEGMRFLQEQPGREANATGLLGLFDKRADWIRKGKETPQKVIDVIEEYTQKEHKPLTKSIIMKLGLHLFKGPFIARMTPVLEETVASFSGDEWIRLLSHHRRE